MIGGIYRRQGRWQEGLQSLALAARLDPQSSEKAFNLAQTYHRLRRWDEAERFFERTVALAPDIGVYRYQFVQLKLNEGRKDEAERVIRELIARAGPTMAAEWLVYGGYYWFSRIFSDLMRDLIERTELATYPDAPWLYYNALGFIHQQEGRDQDATAYWDSSRVVLEKLTATDSARAGHFRQLGLVYAALGRNADAMQAFERRVALTPAVRLEDPMEAPEHVWDRAQLHVLASEPDSAIKLIGEVLAVPARRAVGLLRLDPIWDSLREHPRFQALLAKYEN